mgnify:CR=1 FL=1
MGLISSIFYSDSFNTPKNLLLFLFYISFGIMHKEDPSEKSNPLDLQYEINKTFPFNQKFSWI